MQIENSKLLAQNKLILLHVLHQQEEPMRNTELTHFIVENNYMNYFITQHYISELINTGNVLLSSKMGEPCYQITEKGEKTLLYFYSRIPEEIRTSIENQFVIINEKKERDREIKADFFQASPDELVVNLKAIENEKTIFSLSISVSSQSQAESICQKWKENSSELYKSLMYLFVNPTENTVQKK